jgi:molybdenum cofactor cytidylyltransferase
MLANSVSSTTVGCIVLAAGSSVRFGSDKRHYRLGSGHTLLEQTLLCAQALFNERVLVLRHDDHGLAQRFADHWRVVLARDAGLGMGYSLAAALTATQHWRGAVIALGDMPWVQATTYQAITEALQPNSLVVPYYQGQRGNPVGIGCQHFAALTKAEGDVGARALLQRHPELLQQVQVDDPGILKDLDVLPAVPN